MHTLEGPGLMGSFFSRLFERLSGVREVRLLMLGLDNAGKTSKSRRAF